MPFQPRLRSRSRPAAAGGTWLLPVEIWYAPTPDITCCVAAYQAIGVPGYAESKWNLANIGTNDLSEGIAPAWSPVHGWQFTDAGGTYLKTGIIPDENYSYVIRFTNHDVDDVNSMFGMYGTLSWSRVDLWGTGPAMYWWYGTTEENRPPIATAGVFGLAGNQPYRNGLPDGAALAVAGWDEAAVEIYLGAVNDNGSPLYENTVNIQAFSIYSCPLTDTQMAAIMAAVAHL